MLELHSRGRRLGCVGYYGPERLDAPAARASRNESVDRAQVEEPQPLRLVDGALELPAGHDLGEVEERAGHAGDRDAVEDRALGRIEVPHAVNVDASAPSQVAGRADIDNGTGRPMQTP